ncbi:unnamed protein product [Closterium sp. NIES-54]
MDSKMSSWRSTCTYVNAVPPPMANVVDGMQIFKAKRPPFFKARYVARGFRQREGVNLFHTFWVAYAELVGCLMYLMSCTLLDLAYLLSVLARFVAIGKHRPVQWTVAVRVAKYIATISCMGLVLGGRVLVVLTEHCDLSYADDLETCGSTQGYFFILGYGGVSLRSTRSPFVALSSAEADIYADSIAADELFWLTYLLTDLGERPHFAPTLFLDNKAIILLCREPWRAGARAARKQPLPCAPLLPASSSCPSTPRLQGSCPTALGVAPCCSPRIAPSASCASRSAAPRVALCCSVRRALLQPARRALLPHTSRPAAPRVAPCCSPRVAHCCPAQLATCCLRRPGGAAPPSPGRPSATTVAVAARATDAAGGGAAGSARAASGGQQRSLPLPDDPTPQQLHEWVIQQGSPGGGEAAALGTSESAAARGAGEFASALGARESADALGASASTAKGPASVL